MSASRSPPALVVHINPDHFLETAEGRVTTSGRNAWAWEQCFTALPAALQAARPGARLYVLVGAQGSGKSTWARRLREQEPSAIVFDAILVRKSERAPILLAADEHGVPAVAVWFRTPLTVCLARNAARPPDQVADEQGLRNVFAALEPPTQAEGFVQVLEVAKGDATPSGEARPNTLVHPATGGPGAPPPAAPDLERPR
jgi:AAA domain